jgi:hypothetical protein
VQKYTKKYSKGRKLSQGTLRRSLHQAAASKMTIQEEEYVEEEEYDEEDDEDDYDVEEQEDGDVEEGQ